MHFVMLVPNSLDPAVSGRTMPLPEKRPSARIAKLFPQKDRKPDGLKAATQPSASSPVAPAAKPAEAAAVPAAKTESPAAASSPVMRPEVRSDRQRPRHHRRRWHRPIR
jgi:membrane-bound lytic murein transglycosylase A